MKYLILKSKEIIKIDILKYVFSYYLLTILYFIIYKNTFLSGNLSIEFCLGLKPIIECNSIESILKIILLSLIIFLTYKVYIFDIVQNIENVYLRSNSKKTLILNIFIVLFYITIVRLTLIFIINLFYRITFNTIIFDLLYCYFISISAIIILNIMSKEGFIYKILSVIFCAFLLFFSLIIIKVTYLIVTSIIFLILIFLSYSPQKLVDFFK